MLDSLYSPYKIFSPIYYVSDILPEEYIEQCKGWTVDGAYEHRKDPKSPWKLLVELKLPEYKLKDVVYSSVLHKQLDEAKEYVSYLLYQQRYAIDELKTLREDLRKNKKFDLADKIRDLIKDVYKVEVKDQKLVKP